MKKSLILVAMLSIGYAAAQTTNDYDERVGINTEKPSATLNVKTKNDTTSPKSLELENAGGTKLMTVLNSGNVGIGTDDPKRKLHVKDGNALIELSSTNGGPFLELKNSAKTDGNLWRIYNITGSGYGDALQFYSYKQDGNPLHPVANMSLTDDAKLGIYVTKPTEQLDVNGNARLRTLPSITGAETDKVVVVDNTGVLKSVDRSSISGTSGLTSEVDGIIGNEVTDATANGGLVRSGSGTASSPYTLGLPAGTAVGQTMVWNGTAWEVKAPEAGGTLQALTGKIVERASINATDWKVEGIFALVQTSNATINLPNPADFTNKIISVSNGTGYQLNYNGTHSPNIASTLASGKGHILMSNGTTWFIIGGSY